MKLPWQKKRLVAKRRTAATVRPLRRQIIIGVLLVIGLAGMIVGIYHLSRVASWQIEAVNVVGGRTIPAVTVTQVVEESLVGAYYRLVPKRFIATYPQSEITDRVLQIDRIKHAAVSVTDQELTVVYEEYVPAALWCATATSSDCWFMDRQGYAFSESPQLEGSAFVRFSRSGAKPERGADAFSNDFIATNQSFIELMESELGLFVTHVHVIGDYDLEYTVAGGGVIKVSQTQSLETSLQNLESVITAPEFAHLQAGDFEYIDLRFGDKVFVNEAVDEVATSTATSTDNGE